MRGRRLSTAWLGATAVSFVKNPPALTGDCDRGVLDQKVVPLVKSDGYIHFLWTPACLYRERDVLRVLDRSR